MRVVKTVGTQYLTPKNPFLWRVLVILPIFVMIMSSNCRSRSHSGFSTAKDVLSDSSIILYQISVAGDVLFVNLVTTIECKDGKVTCTSLARLFRSELAIKLSSPKEGIQKADYLKLWQRIEDLGIWRFRRGDLWDLRIRLLSEGVKLLSGMEMSVEEKNEYKEIGIDGSLVGVEVKVGAKRHGFIRYNAGQLKDPRYGRVVGALYDVADMAGIVRELQEAEKR